MRGAATRMWTATASPIAPCPATPITRRPTSRVAPATTSTPSTPKRRRIGSATWTAWRASSRRRARWSRRPWCTRRPARRIGIISLGSNDPAVLEARRSAARGGDRSRLPAPAGLAHQPGGARLHRPLRADLRRGEQPRRPDAQDSAERRAGACAAYHVRSPAETVCPSPRPGSATRSGARKEPGKWVP